MRQEWTMRPELAQYLDGVVAGRFGRPKDSCGIAFQLVSEGTGWSAAGGYHISDPAASALWLAHLLKVCEDRKWAVTFEHANPEPIVYVNGGEDWSAPTQLEALARAMLQVPEDK